MFEKPELDALWDFLLECGIEEQTLQVVTSINGYTKETLDDISYSMYGLSVEHLMEESEE